MRIEAAGEFAATRQRVWAVLADWERQAAWMPDVAGIRVLGPERKLGARLACRTKVLGVPLVTDLVVVTGWDPPRRLAIEHHGFVRGFGEWRLSAAGGDPSGTRLTWVEELTMPPGALGELAMRAYGPVQRAMLRRSIRNLRRLVEA